MLKIPKTLLLLFGIVAIICATAFCEGRDKWEYGIKLLPVYTAYSQSPVDMNVKVLMPTPFPPPDDKKWSETGRDVIGIVGTWRYGGVYLKRKFSLKKHLNFAVETSIEHYLHDDIVTRGGSSSAVFKKHYLASMTLPRIMIYWEPVKYFSWGLGYDYVFWKAKSWFSDFNFVPYEYSGDKELSGERALFLWGASFSMPVKLSRDCEDMVLGLDIYGSIWRFPDGEYDTKGNRLDAPVPGAELGVWVFKMGFN